MQFSNFNKEFFDKTIGKLLRCAEFRSHPPIALVIRLEGRGISDNKADISKINF